MNIAVFGTGIVGTTMASKLISLGQQVTIHVYADSKDVQFVQDFIRYYMTK